MNNTKKDHKLILGIETSCDDTAVALIHNDEILFHERYDQEALLKKWGGVVPEIAARNHLLKITPLLRACFKDQKYSPSDLDLISVTTLPGLLGPLLTGVNAAKSISLIHHTPIIAANHLYAHLEAIHLTESIAYPYLGLLISGGHSIYFWVENRDQFHVLGSTIDDAAGEAFDKGGKLLGLGYPAGHIIDKLAKWGDHNKYKFPIGLQASADARLSFSGLKTSLRVFLEKNPEILDLRPTDFSSKVEASQDFYDVCASYQKAISSALKLKLKYAVRIATEKYQAPKEPTIVVGGGVACNSEIRSDLKSKYKDIHFVAPQFCTDNGAMIANFGKIHFDQSVKYPDSLKLDARGRFINKKDFL